ncbi:MAG: GAF domain-containing protein [Proteobacteria bacterium]|nr:PAS domain S-box protein [Desulfobacula sp.]MBU3953465.1 GAF domain-containing protein [Pseudomonadota bacterium]MBU4132194.1 GAF domain-containing protein [Pseudomonadota bacterium]
MRENPTYEELAERVRSLEKEADLRLTSGQEDKTARKNYNRFLKFLPYPVLIRDKKGLVSYLNPAFTQTFGWTLEELKGKRGRQYIPGPLQEELSQKISGLPPEKNVLKLNTKRLTREGKLLDVIMRVGIERDENNQPTSMIIVFRDVTMERRINRNRSAMNRISQVLPQYPELRKLMQYVSVEIKELLGTEGANVILLDENQKEFYFLSVVHDDPTTQERIKKIRFSIDELIAGQVVKTGNPVMMNSLPDNHRLHLNRDEKIGHKVKNVMVVPLRTKERIIGVITADNKKEGEFDKTDLEILNTIAGTVALSIENAGVSEELQKANQELIGLNAAKDKMISHLSHELKTPVAILLSSFKVLSKKLTHLPEKEWKPTLDRIHRNLYRIIGIEDEIYDIVEKKSFLHKRLFSLIFDQCEDAIETLIAEEIGEKDVIAKVREKLDDVFSSRDFVVQKIYLNRFVEERLRELSPLFAHRNVKTSVGLKSSAPIEIPMDPLQKIVDGLIRNAVENTPNGGNIGIIVHDRGKGVELVVQDHGVGLTREAQKRIFEGFFSPQATLNYSSKRPYDFGAGGKGADLLRMKIFSERYHFKIKMTSKRCWRLPLDTDVCPGNIETCRGEKGFHCDGKTTVSVFFPFPES